MREKNEKSKENTKISDSRKFLDGLKSRIAQSLYLHQPHD